MSENTKTTIEEKPTVFRDYSQYVHEDRRYVPLREIITYILFDVAQTFNINKYNERFNLDVLHISLSWMPFVTSIGGIWDAVNDVLIGAFVDRTRTRWGKFKPYLVMLAIPGTIGTCLFWLLPVMFPTLDEKDIMKFAAYFALTIIRETAGTFRDISRTGMLSTISPHPVERVRLITLAQVLSFGDTLPELCMTLFIDLINSGKIKATMKSLYVGMGCAAAIVAGAFALIFSITARERIVQSVEKPSISKALKSILTNKPILLITLSEFLSAFRISGNMTNYYMDVLGNASLYIIVGIPGAFISTPSYAFVPWMRRRFSTRFLWIIGSGLGDLLMFFVFLFGSIGGKTNGLYKRKGPMIAAIAIQEALFMTVFGIRRVLPEEMFNEAMDYCEWKNGYRTEAMTGVAKGLAKKLVQAVGTTVSAMIMNRIGYDMSAGHLKQSDSTKYYIFAMATALPLVTQLLSLVPKCMYDLSGKKREDMYAQLLERRDLAAKHASLGDAEAMQRLSEIQNDV